jgi:hypothetical protein
MTQMATSGNEVGLGIRWILDRLRTDTGAGGLRNAAAPLVTGVFEGLAPQGSSPPYLEVAYLAGSVISETIDGVEVHADLRFQVKAILSGVDSTPAWSIVKRVHARLAGQGGSFASGAATGDVWRAQRGALISYVEGAPTSPVRHHGHEYTLMVQST